MWKKHNIDYVFRNRQIEAMEWLLEYHNRLKEGDDEPDKFLTPTITDLNADNPLYKITQLLQDIRNFHQQFFDPNPRAMSNLTAMGFNPDDVFHALRVTHNNELNAVSNIYTLPDYSGIHIRVTTNFAIAQRRLHFPE